MTKSALYYLAMVVFSIFGILTIIFAVEATISLYSLGVDITKISQIDYRTANDFARYMGGDFSRLLGIAFTTISIAVPLTANMYSVKFIEIFIKDKLNAFVLFLFVFSELHNTWLVFNIRADFIPVGHLYLSLFLAVLDFSILIPYLFYIAKFLHPTTLLYRLESNVKKQLDDAAKGKKINIWQIEAELEHIANISIRSIDRMDRDTALESVVVFKRMLKYYWKIKDKMPESWFHVERNMFLGFSKAAISDLVKTRTWFEMKIHSKLRDVMSASIPKVHDIVSKIANTTKDLGLIDAANPDLRELTIEYFNTYLRLAINRKDARSVYTIMYQYRNYAEGINHIDSQSVQEIAYYFEYYAQAAFDTGMVFIVETIAHDLADLVRFSYESKSDNSDKLLERFVAFDKDIKSAKSILGVKKAQLILLSYLIQNDYHKESLMLSVIFEQLDENTIEKILDDLIHIKKEKYWEVTDRRINIDYVNDAQKEIISAFMSKLLKDKILHKGQL